MAFLVLPKTRSQMEAVERTTVLQLLQQMSSLELWTKKWKSVLSLPQNLYRRTQLQRP